MQTSCKPRYASDPETLAPVTYDGTSDTSGTVTVNFKPDSDDQLSEIGIATAGLLLDSKTFSDVDSVTVTVTYSYYDKCQKKVKTNQKMTKDSNDKTLTFDSTQNFTQKIADGGETYMYKCFGAFPHPVLNISDVEVAFTVSSTGTGDAKKYSSVNTFCGLRITRDTSTSKKVGMTQSVVRALALAGM